MNIYYVLVFIVSAIFPCCLSRSLWNGNVSDVIPSFLAWDSGEDDFIHAPEARTTLADANLWENGIVPYIIDKKSFPEGFMYDVAVQTIQNAANVIGSESCVQFVPRDDQEDYIVIRYNKNCAAQIGNKGGRQALVINTYCMQHPYLVVHELMHVLGFVHEHNRSDRDDFITVDLDNVIEDRRDSFNKYEEDEIDTFGEEYDYLSIMHYDQHAFAIDPDMPTITPNDPDQAVGGTALSEADIRKLNKLYSC